MVYTQRHPAVLIIGILMLALGFATQAGALDSVIGFLHTQKLKGEMIYLPYIFGAIGVLIGLAKLLLPQKPGHIDYYRSALGGALFILIVAMAVRWFAAPLVAVWSKAYGPIMGDKYIHQVFGLNYVVLGILAGIIIVNVFGIPSWAQNGVRLSRLGLKTGVILLGTLYSLAELVNLGKLSVVLIGIFVLGSVGLVLLFGRLMRIPNSMGGVLSAGVGVCGVSASVAAAPVVQAKSVDIAYTIGTILLWGVGCMFLFPIIGHTLGLGHVQFGAWAGTGILNSAQVAGAALAYQPTGIETLKVAEIFNITRVLFLPIIVLWLAVWYVRRETATNGDIAVGAKSASAMAVEAPKVDLTHVIISKFPLFVLGFILMFALASTGVFAPANHYKGKYFTSEVSSSKLLTDEQVAGLSNEANKLTRPDQAEALQRLIENRKIMSRDDDALLRGVVNSHALSKDATKSLKAAHKAAYKTAPMISWFRSWIVWLFAFGLTGLGMQITIASLKQAGGKPLVIGGIVGTAKAALSLAVIMLFVREII